MRDRLIALGFPYESVNIAPTHADGVTKGGPMSKAAIISVDGHVRASRSD